MPSTTRGVSRPRPVFVFPVFFVFVFVLLLLLVFVFVLLVLLVEPRIDVPTQHDAKPDCRESERDDKTRSSVDALWMLERASQNGEPHLDHS